MPPQTRAVIQRSKSVGKEKRKPVRRDPERRRQQNIQAQKKYRECRSSLESACPKPTDHGAYGSLEIPIPIICLGEKLRERLDRLEALAASAAQSNAIEKTPAAGIEPSEAVTAHDSSSTPTHIMAQSLPGYDASDVSVSSSSAVTTGECQHLTSQSNDTPSALSIWDFASHVDPSLLIRDNQNDGLGPCWTTTIDCSCPSPHVQIRTYGPDPSSNGQVSILSFGPRATAVDPYANNLRIETVCVTAALHTLGMYVGINEGMLCADQSLSPFFRSSAESADDMVKANMIFVVQRIFKTLKSDLRPISEQITIEHHPYIDILPFPTLRKNLITHQEEIDEDEFFHDILTGLVCWGGAGIGRKDREDSTGYVSTGTPWDVRSWEARV